MTKLPRSISTHPSAIAETDWLSVTRRMKAGDSKALTVFYEHVFDLMFREVKRLINRDEQTSLDIVQDAMLKAIRCIKPLPDAGAVVAWSKTVVRSTTYDWLRKQGRQNAHELSAIDQPIQKEQLVDEDSARMLWIEEQLQAMSPELRRLIRFRYRLGWSLRRIAESLGLKTGTVDGRIRRAIEKLQEKAKREFDE